MSRTYVIPKGSMVIRNFMGKIDTFYTTARCNFDHAYYYHDEDKDFLILRWVAEYHEPCVWYVPKDTLQVVTT